MTDSIVPPLKRCTKCGNEYPATIDYYHREPRLKSGLSSQCKECTKQNNRKYRLNNPDKLHEYEKRRHAENPQRSVASHRRWREQNRALEQERVRAKYAQNPEKRRVECREWNAQNPDKRKAMNKRWATENPEKIRELARRRRAVKRGALSTFTAQHEQFALTYFNQCCAVCGRQLYDLFGTHRLEWDHWIPLSKGGHTTPDNMVPLCGGVKGCNTRKFNRDARDWLASIYKPSQVKAILSRINAYFEWIKKQDQ